MRRRRNGRTAASGSAHARVRSFHRTRRSVEAVARAVLGGLGGGGGGGTGPVGQAAKRRVAIHEAGHALAAHTQRLCEDAIKVHP